MGQKAHSIFTRTTLNYSRGKIIVLDRERLEQRVCECWAVVKKEFDRLLPYTDPVALFRQFLE